MEVQQASTDTCSFFNQAYVLSGGELVYHGGSSEQAMAVLGGSGMPCPPLYHPIEQYMRLIDPSFEVSLLLSVCCEFHSWAPGGKRGERGAACTASALPALFDTVAE